MTRRGPRRLVPEVIARAFVFTKASFKLAPTEWSRWNVSLRRAVALEETLAAGVDTMHVSMSGMTQEIHQINHVGAHLEYTLEHLIRCAEIVERRSLSSRIIMKFLRFPHNVHHVDEARAFAERTGLEFEVLDAGGDPFNSTEGGRTDAYYRGVMAKADRSAAPEAHGKVCELLFDIISIDFRGDVYLCCPMPSVPAFRIGRFLEMSADEILLRRYTHSFCPSCSAPRRAARRARLTRQDYIGRSRPSTGKDFHNLCSFLDEVIQ